MSTGSHVQKNPKIDDFINQVIVPGINRIARDADQLGVASDGAPDRFLRRSDLNIRPLKSVNTRAGEITAAALADLFISHAQRLTSIRRSTLVHNLINTNSSGTVTLTTSTIWSNQITALSSYYALSSVQLRNRVTSGSNPLTNLQPGNVAAASALDALITKLNSILAARVNESVGTLETYSCHSSCHNSCHNSRGRR